MRTNEDTKSRQQGLSESAGNGRVNGKEDRMCLTCGCMDAHLQMGESNIRFEDVKRAADENSRSVAETLEIMERTAAKDREGHPEEYAPGS